MRDGPTSRSHWYARRRLEAVATDAPPPHIARVPTQPKFQMLRAEVGGYAAHRAGEASLMRVFEPAKVREVVIARLRALA